MRATILLAALIIAYRMREPDQQKKQTAYSMLAVLIIAAVMDVVEWLHAISR